jgi:hypothetical protein
METLKVINFNKLIQVHTKTFTGNTQMITEIEIICHSDIVMSIFRILFYNKLI